MIIIVDAYNVLKQFKQDEINQLERNAFLKKLEKYAQIKRHTLIVVFDGGASVWPMIEKDCSMTVVYSGERLSADDYIRRYMKEHKNKELLLVTNDGELKKNAQRYEIDTLDSMEFYRLINSLKEKKKERVIKPLLKLSTDSLYEIDMLMAAVDSVPEKKESFKNIRNPSGFTLSKKERKISKKIKKL